MKFPESGQATGEEIIERIANPTKGDRLAGLWWASSTSTFMPMVVNRLVDLKLSREFTFPNVVKAVFPCLGR
jgi:hypothetical protein